MTPIERARKLALILNAAADKGDAEVTRVLTWMQKSATLPTKRQLKWNGLTIHVEYEKGAMRHGRELPAAYGYIAATHALDGDGIDVFLGPKVNSCKDVYVIRQMRGKDFDIYDEDKVMLGYNSYEDAKAAFCEAQEKKRFGGMHWMPVGEFVDGVKRNRSVPEPVGGWNHWFFKDPAVILPVEMQAATSVGAQILRIYGDPTQPKTVEPTITAEDAEGDYAATRERPY